MFSCGVAVPSLYDECHSVFVSYFVYSFVFTMHPKYFTYATVNNSGRLVTAPGTLTTIRRLLSRPSHIRRQRALVGTIPWSVSFLDSLEKIVTYHDDIPVFVHVL